MIMCHHWAGRILLGTNELLPNIVTVRLSKSVRGMWVAKNGGKFTEKMDAIMMTDEFDHTSYLWW